MKCNDAAYTESEDPFSWGADDYLSPHLPNGFNTVIGYMAATNPEALGLVGEPVRLIREEQQRLYGFVLAHSVAVELTFPPPALVGCVRHLWVYPTAFLAAFAGEAGV